MRYFSLLALALVLFACDKPADVVECPAAPDLEPDHPVTVESEWFTVSYIEPLTYQIRETSSTEGNTVYLLIGSERAVLFDAGTGENAPVDGTKIMHLVEQLTTRPVTLVLSHFHYDHVQNAEEPAALAFPDLQWLHDGTDSEGNYPLTNQELIVGTTPSSLHVTDWWPVNEDIDLGGRNVQLLHVPGHAPESVVLADHTNKQFFMGDFLYNGPLFSFDESEFGSYEASTDALLAVSDASYALYGAHGYPPVNYSKLETMVGLWDCIAAGDCIPTITTYWGQPVKIYEFGGLELVLFL